MAHTCMEDDMSDMAHVYMIHATHMNDSWLMYEWDILNACIRHVTGVNESCHTYK